MTKPASLCFDEVERQFQRAMEARFDRCHVVTAAICSGHWFVLYWDGGAFATVRWNPLNNELEFVGDAFSLAADAMSSLMSQVASSSTTKNPA